MEGQLNANTTGSYGKDSIVQPASNISNFFILKNLVCVSLAFVMNFTASNALGTLQSSINSDQGLGTASLSVFYAAMIISCMFFPTFIIKKIGCKWTMAVSILGFTSLIAANFQPNWATMIPTALLQGFAAGPLWSSKCVYITQIAKLYAVRNKASVDNTTYAFFGIFYTMFQTHQIWGNLMSSKILEPRGNSSFVAFSDKRLAVCGSNYCNEDLDSFDSTTRGMNSTSNNQSSHEENDQLRLLVGIYLGMSLCASLVIVFFVNQIPESKSVEAEPVSSGLWLIVATFRQLRYKTQLLLIPLTVYRGIMESFDVADFTKAFITCPLGVHEVGLIAICGGIVSSVFALIYGFLIKLFGRIPVFLFAAAAGYASIFVMLNVHPVTYKPLHLYMMDSMIGLGEACWQSQISALYGVLFCDHAEAAFSSFRLFDSIGLIAGYSWNTYLCIQTKIWIMFGFLSAGLLGYLAVEVITYLKSKQCVKPGQFQSQKPDVILIAYINSHFECKSASEQGSSSCQSLFINAEIQKH